MDNLFRDAVKISSPNAFHVMVKPAGPSCNLRCTYCYYLEKKNLFSSNTFKMSDEIFENYTRQFIEANEVPEVTFTWQGGEPTLMGIDFFKNAIKLQNQFKRDKIIHNSFQTNGTLLNDEWCKFFTDNNILVGISIDGEEHNHNKYRKTISGGTSFKAVMKGIELLHKHKVEFNTLSCVNSYNVNYASETYKFLKRIGSGFIQFLPVVERETSLTSVTEWSVGAKDFGKFLTTVFDEWVRHDVARYYIQIFDVTLANYAGETPGICVFSETCGDALALEHNGDLFSCDHFVYPEYKLGNISETSLITLAKSQRQLEFGIDKRNKLPQYCLKCDVRYACHGECPKHRFLNTPDGKHGLNYLCEAYKHFFHHVEPFMEYMAKELKNKRAPANVMQWIKNKDSQAVKTLIPERNDPCPCGSGKKFKNCCAGKPLYNY